MKNIPKVRFPEFRDAPEWEEKKLIDLCEKISDGIHSTPIYDDNGEFYFINGNNLTNSKIEITENTKKINETEYLKYKVELSSQTILISINGTIGNLAFFNNEKIILGKSASYINLKLNENKYFIFNLLQSSNTKKHFEKELTGSTIKNLSLTTIKNTKVFFPHPKEQQKIAECLSSLDALILAQSSKVEALKAHKKALMQQLFPAEGKTTPRLRFPEFQNDGEWEKNDFSNYIKLYRGSSPRPIQEYLTKDASGVNWIKIGDTKNAVNSIINKVEEKITQEGAEKSRKVNVGELILANSMSFGKTYELEIEGCIYDGWFVLREYEEYFYKPFLLQLLNSEYMQQQYQKLSAGGIVQNISSDIVYETILFYTSIKEQQKIAECLSSLDALISAQSSKVEALKQHKKALMQQLFPTCKVTS